MNVRIALACLLLVGACTNDPAPKPTASATLEPKGLVVAVPIGAAGVSLYRIGEDRHPVLLQTLLSPRDHPQEIAVDVTLSGGSRPDACVAWGEDGADSQASGVICYPFGETTGQVLAASSDASAVALSADGTQVAWLSNTWTQAADDTRSRTEQRVSIGRYQGAKVEGVTTTEVYSASGQVQHSLGCKGIEDLTWAGPRLLVECDGIDNSPGRLQLQAPGLSGEPVPIGDHMAGPYNYYGHVVNADAAGGLGIQGEFCDITCPDADRHPEPRAVRFDLATGKVLEVIATSAAGRSLDSVSGGAHGVLYVTSGGRAQAVYVRFQGEKHGTRIEGLPATYRIVAQP